MYKTVYLYDHICFLERERHEERERKRRESACKAKQRDCIKCMHDTWRHSPLNKSSQFFTLAVCCTVFLLVGQRYSHAPVTLAFVTRFGDFYDPRRSIDGWLYRVCMMPGVVFTTRNVRYVGNNFYFKNKKMCEQWDELSHRQILPSCLFFFSFIFSRLRNYFN